MDERELHQLVERWRFPLGPFTSPEDVADDMASQASRIGPAAADELARALVAFADAADPRLGDLYEFVQVYLRAQPEPMSRALFGALRPDGPPELVELAGLAGDEDTAQRLRASLDLAAPPAELVVAVASALGSAGGPGAAELLDELESRSDLAPEAHAEIVIARERLAPGA